MAKNELSERDRQIIESIVNPDSMLLGPAFLSEAAARSLAERIADRKQPLEPAAVAKALHHIVRSLPAEESADLVISVAQDTDNNRQVRRSAIAALGSLPSRLADAALAEALGNCADFGESTVLKALAQAGGEEGLTAIRALPATENTRLLGLRAFADAAISLRLGKVPAEAAERIALPAVTHLEIVPEDKKKLTDVISHLDGDPFSIEINPSLGFSFACAGCRHVILLNASIEQGALIKAVTEKPLIGGVIVMADRASGRYVMRYTILLLPEKSGIRVSVLRNSGEVALAGRLSASDDGLELTLRDLGSEARPVQLTGRITNDRIELDAQIYSNARKAKLTGLPLN